MTFNENVTHSTLPQLIRRFQVNGRPLMAMMKSKEMEAFWTLVDTFIGEFAPKRHLHDDAKMKVM